jgi:ribosomal protein S27E
VATGQQRLYKAPCPNCGAQVEFKSAGSAVAVCGFCSSTLVREGEALRKIGEQSEVFEDYSPLQIGTSGRNAGITFTIIGRLQYRYGEGTWTNGMCCLTMLRMAGSRKTTANMS